MARAKQHELLKEVFAWFQAREMGLFVSHDDAGYWANLFSLRSLEVFAPRYGKGETPEQAAQSARDRYLTEET